MRLSSTVEYASKDCNLKYIDKKLKAKDLFDTSFFDSARKSMGV
jgi:hypothetical protein